MPSSIPVIGLTMDREPGGDTAYSRFPWYAIRANYMSSVIKAGGLPVALPHAPCLAEAMLDRIDGLIVTGGAFDIDPALYASTTQHHSVTLKPERTQAELTLLNGARARNMPVLGICGGMQLLAVALGGTLFQHIPDDIPNALPHEQPNPRDEASHIVTLTHGTQLARIVGRPAMAVNSSHHQAVRDPGTGIVSALAEDGVIEAIEDPTQRFCLGVQWHPEFTIDPGDLAILNTLIQTAGAQP